MTKFRSFAMVMVVGAALFASRAQAETDAGWNTKYGMIFSLDNPFRQSASAGFLSDFGGGVGAQLNLSPQTAIRMVVRLNRTSDPVYTTDTQVSGGPVTHTITIPNPTSTFGTTIGASYLYRLTSSALSPYLGAGASLFWDSSAREGTDDDTPGTTIKYDWSDRTYGIGVVGQLGLEWRVHKSVSLFAEYGLNVSGFSSTSSDHKTTNNGLLTQTKYTQTRYFNFDTALNQGAQLGLVALF